MGSDGQRPNIWGQKSLSLDISFDQSNHLLLSKLELMKVKETLFEEIFKKEVEAIWREWWWKVKNGELVVMLLLLHVVICKDGQSSITHLIFYQQVEDLLWAASKVLKSSCERKMIKLTHKNDLLRPML